MNSKLRSSHQNVLVNPQMYSNITKAKLRNMRNLSPTASGLYNTERINNITKLVTGTSPFIAQQKKQAEALRSKTTTFYRGFETNNQQALKSLVEQRSKMLEIVHFTAFQSHVETDFQKKLRALAEQSKKNQERFKEIFAKFNKKFEYFNANGWVVPDELDPAELSNINSEEEANEFMKANITKNNCLLLLTLNTCLEQDDLPNNARELLGSVINSLENSYSSYKVMLPTIFSIIDCLIREWLSEYVEAFKYVNKKAINYLKTETEKKKNNKPDQLFYLYQSSIWIDILSNKYYPENEEKENTSLTRNSVAHGSFDYTKYTIYDFTKVALILEHISGLRKYFEK